VCHRGEMWTGTGTGTGNGTGHNCSVHGRLIGSVQDRVGQLVKPPLLCLPVAEISALAPNPRSRCYLHGHLFEVGNVASAVFQKYQFPCHVDQS